MFLFGLVAGIILFMILAVVFMPKMMIKTYKSKYGYDETVEKVNKAIEENNWSKKGINHFDEEIKNKTGEDIGARITAIHICKAKYAKEILKQENVRFVSSIMPCTISIWEKNNKDVMISKMNTGLMGKMFGGIIAKIMGGYVSKEEKKMLEDIITP